MSLWDFAKMKDSILMKGCSIPHCKEDGLRAFSVRNVILGYTKHNEADYRYITTCQEKSCHLEMCTSKDYSANRNLLDCSPGKEWGHHCLPAIHPYPSCSAKVGTGLGLVGRWMALGQLPYASRGDLMDSSKVLNQQLPQTPLIPQQQEQGTGPHVDISSQGTLQSKLKTSPRKGSRWLNFVLELPRSFGNQPLFNTPNKDVKVSLNILCWILNNNRESKISHACSFKGRWKVNDMSLFPVRQ